MNRISIAFVGTASSVFVSRTAEVLRSFGIDVVVVDPYANTIFGWFKYFGSLGRMAQRFVQTWKAIRAVGYQDAAIIHFISIDAVWQIPLLKRFFPRVVCLAYGSDILRRKRIYDWFLISALQNSDCICATNSNVLDVIALDFPKLLVSDRRILRFGLPVLDELDDLLVEKVDIQALKKNLGLDLDREIVALGYSASPGQRQQELISLVTKYQSSFEHIQFVVPVQYGSIEISKAIVTECRAANASIGREYLVPLTNFFDVAQSAKLRLVIKVLINHSVTDSFSGTVQETVFAGNLVIAGSHLPYARMAGSGSSIRTFDSIEDLPALLTPKVLSIWTKLANKEIDLTRNQLRRDSSWNGVIDDWRCMIAGDEKCGQKTSLGTNP